MIEDILMQLEDILNVPVRLEFPKGEHKRFVVFEVVERQKQNYIDAVTVEFSSYAESKYQAAVLDKAVRHAVESLISNNQITSIKFGGGSSGDSYDETMKRYRYRCYYSIFFYEEE